MLGVICGVKETGSFKAQDGKDVPASVKFTVLYRDIDVEGIATQIIGLSESKQKYGQLKNGFGRFGALIGCEVEFSYAGNGNYAKLAQFDITNADCKPIDSILALCEKVYGPAIRADDNISGIPGKENKKAVA
ncbi:MAG: hypothetical protein LBM93_09490 [Oscillospiraceae bacterium]|jgi:hypothetical protein|nr:hypothetical protein [Oscillospiraceae bacterium]